MSDEFTRALDAAAQKDFETHHEDYADVPCFKRGARWGANVMAKMIIELDRMRGYPTGMEWAQLVNRMKEILK